MRATVGPIGSTLLFAFYVAVSSGFCVSTGQTVKLEGYVVSANGDSVTMRTKDPTDVDVTVTEFTKISTPKGLLGKKHMPPGSLVPGLWIKMQGMGSNPGRVIAKTISFRGNDYRTATAIKAGLVPVGMRLADSERQIQANAQNIRSHDETIRAHEQNLRASQQQIQEINQKFSKLADYDVKYSLNVYFPSGSATLSELAKNDLMQLAKSAASLRSYLIEVEAHTDASGSLDKNQQLSMHRASSVIAFLQQEGNIPVRRVLMPGPMGESHPGSSNTSVQGREANRRAEVQVLVDRGLTGE